MLEVEWGRGDGDPSVLESEDRGRCTDGVLPNSTRKRSSSRLLYRLLGREVEGAGWGSDRVVASSGIRLESGALSSSGGSKEAD